jgi:hypothetical protein
MTSATPQAPKAARVVPLIAAAISMLAFAVWGVDRGIAALAGGVVAVLNWYALHWIVARIAQGEARHKAAVSLLLVLKLGFLIAVVFVLIRRLDLDPLGVLLGLATLFVAPVLDGLVLGPSAAKAAQEER